MFTSHTDDIHVTSLCIAIYGLRITDIYRLGVLQERERERGGGERMRDREGGERERESERESGVFRSYTERQAIGAYWRRYGGEHDREGNQEAKS